MSDFESTSYEEAPVGVLLLNEHTGELSLKVGEPNHFATPGWVISYAYHNKLKTLWCIEDPDNKAIILKDSINACGSKEPVGCIDVDKLMNQLCYALDHQNWRNWEKKRI